MNPKYSVGEVVVINCPILPDLHGTEHSITEICEVTFSDHNNTVLLCYKLGFTFEWCGVKDYPYWREESLWKKHEPSQMSFQSLIRSINSPVKQES